MKFLSELGSCFYGGSASVTPAVEISTSSKTRQQDETSRANCDGGGSSHAATGDGLRKVRSSNASRNWKPKLHVISEDSVATSRDSSQTIRSDDKSSVFKVKAKSKPRVPLSTDGDDYWKSSSSWAVPAFSPTPFSF